MQLLLGVIGCVDVLVNFGVFDTSHAQGCETGAALNDR